MTNFEGSQVNVSTGSGNNEVEDVEPDSASGGSNRKRKTSFVWNYMNGVDVNGVMMAKLRETMNGWLNSIDIEIQAMAREFELYKSQADNIINKSELERYLDEQVENNSPDFDILSWWKGNKGKYPILAKIARDILAIPMSTVVSESVFSAWVDF
ncbi:hypothetical protein Ddye_023278 [Dipteronia dyeriana]|uniref:HAT C-terminal dimerisation domain-containing protein n=1 Tax=Dipteronia dyeriana TaxID=168575 RepID=A0AAD9TTM7_9ROSI|nr:hypothetical protein Ddye_023278 [Dipteronia dyeriana]